MSNEQVDTTLAMNYMMAGVNFWESAKIIDRQLEKKNDGTPKKMTVIPFYFLVSHSIELFLKASLVKRGWIENDLMKYEYRHGLNNLLDALQKEGIIVTETTINVINALHTQHMKHEIRYHKIFGTSKINLISTNLIHEALEELLLLTRISTQGK